MVIKILGSGCPNCVKLEANTKKAVEELGIEAIIEKITDMELIIGYGVMSTPALVVDENVMTYGIIPGIPEIQEILTNKINQSQTQNIKPASSCSCGGKC